MKFLFGLLAVIMIIAVLLVPISFIALIWCDKDMEQFFIKLLLSDIIVLAIIGASANVLSED